MNNTDRMNPVPLALNPGCSVRSLVIGINIVRCPCPEESIRPRFGHVINVHRIAIRRSCDSPADLRHAMFDALLDHRLKILPAYAALAFNGLYPACQLKRPFVADGYAFGMPGYDPFSDLGAQYASSEFSTIDQFAVKGTSRHLVMLATDPTDVDLGRFEDRVVERDFRKSVQRLVFW